MTEEDRPLSDAESLKVRRLLKAFPDDESVDQAVELFNTYRSLGHLGKLLIGFLKILAVVAAGAIAWMQLRGLWKGGLP